MRTRRARRRHNDWNHIFKKRNIFKYVWGDSLAGYPLHKLSKGKVHCSCPMCATKTKKDGWKYSDLKEIERMDYVDEGDD